MPCWPTAPRPTKAMLSPPPTEESAGLLNLTNVPVPPGIAVVVSTMGTMGGGLVGNGSGNGNGTVGHLKMPLPSSSAPKNAELLPLRIGWLGKLVKLLACPGMGVLKPARGALPRLTHTESRNGLGQPGALVSVNVSVVQLL